jgi:hypothetical protein
VLQKSPLLQQESIGVVILSDTFTAPEEAASVADHNQQPQQQQPQQQGAGARPLSSTASSSSPLAQAFLEFPLISGSLLPVFAVGERERRQLVAKQGEDVVEVRFLRFSFCVCDPTSSNAGREVAQVISPAFCPARSVPLT